MAGGGKGTSAGSGSYTGTGRYGAGSKGGGHAISGKGQGGECDERDGCTSDREKMKKISCSKCKHAWDKDEYVDYHIHSGIGGNRHTPSMRGHIKIQDMILCPICFFERKEGGLEYPESYEAKIDRVILKESNVKIKSVVLEDEFGRYIDMDIKDFKKLKVSGFDPHFDDDDVDDHTSVWGGAGPDCTIKREGVPQS